MAGLYSELLLLFFLVRLESLSWAWQGILKGGRQFQDISLTILACKYNSI